MLMSICWFRDRCHRQTTDSNTSILWYVLSSLMLVRGWGGSCTWSWPVVGAALAARCAVTERQEAERRWWNVPLLLLPSLLYIIHSSISPADTVQWWENKQWRLRRAFAAKFLSWNPTGADRETSAVDPKMRSACVLLQGKVSCQKAKFGPILWVWACCVHCCLKLHPTFLPAVLLLLLSGLSRAQPLLLPGSCNFELGTCGYTSDPDYGDWSMNEEGTRSWNHASNALQFSRVGGSVL